MADNETKVSSGLFLTKLTSFHLVLCLHWWVCHFMFKPVRLSCIQSDRFDTTVYVYGSWLCPWFPSVDRRYTSQCCWTEQRQIQLLDSGRRLIHSTQWRRRVMMVMWLIQPMYGSESWSCLGSDLGEIFTCTPNLITQTNQKCNFLSSVMAVYLVFIEDGSL